jgi:hypothetical protein
MDSTTCLALAGVTAGVYLLIGILVLVRRNRKEISSKSPWLLLFSHIGNMCEQVVLLLQISGWLNHGNRRWSDSIAVFFHFLYYFPYLLRGYRLHFVFYTELGRRPQEEAYFLTHLKRSKQTWLLRTLFLLMFPIAILSVLLAFFGHMDEDGPQNNHLEYSFDSVYIAVQFTEDILFILMIYALRHVSKDYSMTRELLIVCFLWYFNSVFSLRYEYLGFWFYELLARNVVIMCVSVLYPLIKSYHQPSLNDNMTLEALYMLPLVLEHEVSLTYFEAYLRSKNTGLNLRPTNEEAMEAAGLTVLNLYMTCKVHKHTPSDYPAATLLADFQSFKAQYELLPTELMQRVAKDLDGDDGWSEGLMAAEMFLFELLRTFYFPMFQRSVLFGCLCKEVEQAELRGYRLGAASFIHEEGLK